MTQTSRQQSVRVASQASTRELSTPRLGDGLLTVLTRSPSPTNSDEYTKPTISTVLTSSNLSQLAKSMNSDAGIVPVRPGSTCSEDGIILIGSPHESTDFKSSFDHSSRRCTPQGDETPPTLPIGDNSLAPFNSEGILNVKSSIPVNGETCHKSKFTPLPSRKSEDTTLCSGNPSTALLSDSRVIAEALPASEKVPDAEALHGIVRGFFATETKEKIYCSTAEPQQYLDSIPATPKKLKSFRESESILESYARCAIPAEEAKETAKQLGSWQAFSIINEIGELKKKTSSSHVPKIIFPASQTTARAQNGVSCDVFVGPKDDQMAALTQHGQNSLHHDLMLKLDTHIAEDDFFDAARPLHVFVDMSNIHIGFCNSWKTSQNIPLERRVRAPPFNFKVFAYIIERNRLSKKKFLASSVANHIVNRTQWPPYFIDAEKEGYETSILSRVQKIAPMKVGRQRKISKPGVTRPLAIETSGNESTADLGKAGYATRNGEQGVDEILHLKMATSIMENIGQPGSMVLATGDAAKAEFSEGFMSYATRALSLGWTLELVTWKANISSAWVDPVFREQYREHFRIIYLDGFLNELNSDLYTTLT
ncbi:hypothetical protein F4777DRAFT_579167 [Nemania sp. FL0916]|nr:hypothetical protein F4777DRAFT_579167 [Nemania sp. FL0916]